jgi:transcription initiation factor IIF auxiliary subunit
MSKEEEEGHLMDDDDFDETQFLQSLDAWYKEESAEDADKDSDERGQLFRGELQRMLAWRRRSDDANDGAIRLLESREATLRRLRALLSREFDVELSAKRAELSKVVDRLSKARAQAMLLQSAGQYCEHLSALRSAVKAAGIGSVMAGGDDSSWRLRKNKSKLYARAEDGSVVQVVCPMCKKQPFSSELGFLNHMRIAHKIRFSTFADAVVHCGLLVDESVLPFDHPIRRALDEERRFDAARTVSGRAFGSGLAAISPSSSSPASKRVADASDRLSSPSSSTLAPSPSTNLATPERRGGGSDRRKSKSSDDDGDDDGDEIMSVVKRKRGRPRKDPNAPLMSYRHKKKRRQSEAATAASRFYVRKRVIVGNTSQYVGQPGGKAPTHKWMVYVRSGDGADGSEAGDLSEFIQRVRFFLHPSYAPNDVIEVLEPPYHLTRRGWGEFPVRVQLHFRHAQNKPVDVIHHLRFDQAHTGLQMLGAETPVDIELDRRTLAAVSSVPLFYCKFCGRVHDNCERCASAYRRPATMSTVAEFEEQRRASLSTGAAAGQQLASSSAPATLADSSDDDESCASIRQAFECFGARLDDCNEDGSNDDDDDGDHQPSKLLSRVMLAVTSRFAADLARASAAARFDRDDNDDDRDQDATTTTSDDAHDGGHARLLGRLSKLRIVSALHVHCAAMTHERFDFLANQGLAD